MAPARNPVTWSLGSLNGLRAGFLGVLVLCRSGVRAKFGVNMVDTGESEFSTTSFPGSFPWLGGGTPPSQGKDPGNEVEFSRLVKEERTGPGWKHSRQKLPRPTVVG